MFFCMLLLGIPLLLRYCSASYYVTVKASLMAMAIWLKQL